METIPPVEFDRLELRSRAAIVWGFAWRALLAVLASAVCGLLVGVLLGFSIWLAAALFGYRGSPERLQRAGLFPSAVVGVAIGIAIYWQYVRWLFRARLGGYRLRLTRDG